MDLEGAGRGGAMEIRLGGNGRKKEREEKDEKGGLVY